MLYSVCASAAVDVFGRLVCAELQEARRLLFFMEGRGNLVAILWSYKSLLL